MENSEKTDKLLEGLNALLEKEDAQTATLAVAILYAAYLIDFAKANKEDAQHLMNDVNDVIKEESGWMQ